MGKKILWVSRHQPGELQIKELKRLFGVETTVQPTPMDVSSAEKIRDFFKSGGFDDLVVVAPYSVLDHLCRLDLRPLWSVNPEVKKSEEWSFQYNGRFYRFDGFKRVVKLELVLEDLE